MFRRKIFKTASPEEKTAPEESVRPAASFSIIDHPDMPFARHAASRWLLRLLPCAPVTGALLTLANWASGGALNLLPQQVTGLAREAARKYGRPSETVRDMLDDLEQLCCGPAEEFFNALPEYYGMLPQLPALLHRLVREALERVVAQEAPAPGRESARAWDRFRDLLLLDRPARQIAMLFYWMNFFGPVHRFFSEDADMSSMYGLRALDRMLDLPSGGSKRAVDDLIAVRLLMDNGRNALAFNMDFCAFWADGEDSRLPGLFRLPMTGEALPLEAFPLKKDEADMAVALLRAGARERPVNILLYGPAGSGKTACARALAEAAGCRVWTVPPEGYFQRDAALDLCTRLAAGEEKSCLIVDSADQFLDSEIFSGRETTDNAWLGTVLETPGRVIIWTVGDTSHMEPTIKRRFSYSLHLGVPDMAQRRRLWRELGVRVWGEGALADADADRLALRFELPAGIAATAAQRLSCPGMLPEGADSAARAAALEALLASHERLAGNGLPPRRKPAAARGYTLDGVCLAQGSGDVRSLLERCRGADARLCDGSLDAGACTFLFYGPPGTGKTALARHIADQLSRECVVVQAADLLDSYVGMTERNIAATFARAERNGAVLVVDEADSFIFSRDMAHHSWESTMVNQFLTSLESYRGFCICTTNRRESMDSAAMRRFTFKIGFTWAGPAQVLALFRAMLEPGCCRPLAPEEEARLLGLKRLVPGDFNTVRGQFAFAASPVEPGVLLDALSRELRTRLHGSGGSVGF
ncbi:MAG: ATP-binding protein [Desulfovibrionaceae bacterium]|nr:ATP-binding protein [Desulfovibrionaceae bacterium]